MIFVYNHEVLTNTKIDTELPEFVFETSFKIVPSNPSSEVAPCFELEPVYEIS